jgi:hypothetical protein
MARGTGSANGDRFGGPPPPRLDVAGMTVTEVKGFGR